MSNQSDRFLGGFAAGTLFGSIAGAFLGTWLATKLNEQTQAPTLDNSNGESLPRKSRRVTLRDSKELSMEEARQGLEEKIAQLNDAIDQAREQLSQVNGTTPESHHS
ncbi:hypothetical protein GS597_00610 [Synechococcales cyanobacterium C]|uniref:Gas vesicle protein n=1 Tax=Petrachloros mirabilis ULC683 TaxID=2781853 RepID=A0A8K2AN94_9CYAN|nr:hypothetical protein [Petrachloros mirabilis]NCJ05043.1 hypothetical protein [Petrachloros mirabilis ULC683]